MSTKYTCKICGAGKYGPSVSGICNTCKVSANRKEKIERWLRTGDMGISVNSTIKGFYRDYIYNEQDGKCAICGLGNQWNGKKLVFVIDHIDGNAANNRRDNLRLICPNCDSQLDTFKSKNKNSKRIYRKQYRENLK